MLRQIKAGTNKDRSLNQQLKLQDNNEPVPTALRHHRLTLPAASAYLSPLPSSQAERQPHRQVDLLPVKERHLPALVSLQLGLVPALKQQTQL